LVGLGYLEITLLWLGGLERTLTHPELTIFPARNDSFALKALSCNGFGLEELYR
jgi:hypothetical protein